MGVEGKSHCDRGHPLTRENVDAKYDRCRACKREDDAAWRERKRAGVVAIRPALHRRGTQPISKPALLAGLIEAGYSPAVVARWAHVEEARILRTVQLAGLEMQPESGARA